MKLVLQYSLENIEETMQNIMPQINGITLLLFEGEMGAGKTTLIKQLCKQLGVEEIVSSPTYSIVNEYSSRSIGKIFHFDLFRLKNEKEAEEIGLDEYLDSKQLCIVEWPEMAPTLLANRKALRFQLEYENESMRKITLSTIN